MQTNQPTQIALRRKFRINNAMIGIGVLMIAAGDNRWQHSTPPDVDAFQTNVRTAWDKAPKVVGNWLGSDIALPTAAIKLLRPNASLNRAYHNLVTGEDVTVLAVQCGDARDMEGHYPPNCYPGNGNVLESQAPVDFAGGVVKATEYSFYKPTPVGNLPLWVAGTFNLQGGVSARNMKEMRVRAREGGRRYYGVAQFQVVIAGTVPQARKIEIAEEFFKAYAPLLEAAGSQPLTSGDPGQNASTLGSSQGSLPGLPQGSSPTALSAEPTAIAFKLFHAERTGS